MRVLATLLPFAAAVLVAGCASPEPAPGQVNANAAAAERHCRTGTMICRKEGLPDKVQPGENGWLVDPDDAGALADAIDAAAGSAERLPSMGARSRQIVEREFAWPVLADRQIAIYEQLLQRR